MWWLWVFVGAIAGCAALLWVFWSIVKSFIRDIVEAMLDLW